MHTCGGLDGSVGRREGGVRGRGGEISLLTGKMKVSWGTVSLLWPDSESLPTHPVSPSALTARTFRAQLYLPLHESLAQELFLSICLCSLPPTLLGRSIVKRVHHTGSALQSRKEAGVYREPASCALLMSRPHPLSRQQCPTWDLTGPH